jgi:hypothetical protein
MLLLMTPLSRAGWGDEPRSGSAFDHGDYDRLLRAYVDDEGLVDYRGLKEQRARLDRYLERVGAVPAPVFSSWSSDTRKAFLINAYNAYTLQAILDHYPIRDQGLFSLYPRNSVRQITGVWNETTHRVAGRDLTLDQIEHDHLRPGYADPRIHFALVCAARGCPPLRPVAYNEANIDSLLDAAGRRFLRQEKKNRLDRDRGVLYLSKIFDWYGDDFIDIHFSEDAFPFLKPKKSAVVKGLLPLMPEPWQDWINSGRRFRVAYTKYDWTLNEQSPASFERDPGSIELSPDPIER